LANAVSSNVAIGFPRLSDRAKSIGDSRITVIFVDFSDAPASQTPQQVFALISPTTENFVKQTSYSKLNVIFTPNYKWLRMSKSSASYNMKSDISFDSMRVYMSEAATLALADGVDFSASDQFLVLTNPAATNVAYGPAFCSSPGLGVIVNGKEFTNGVTSGADITAWSTFWYIHEFAHTLGLPDLYASTGTQFGYTGGWSTMGP
jgi:M6 family metalloprotease-like protein